MWGPSTDVVDSRRLMKLTGGKGSPLFVGTLLFVYVDRDACDNIDEYAVTEEVDTRVKKDLLSISVDQHVLSLVFQFMAIICFGETLFHLLMLNLDTRVHEFKFECINDANGQLDQF